MVFETLDFIARLAAIAPRLFVNLTRYHGVLPPNYRWRTEMTPSSRGRRKGKLSVQPERSVGRAGARDHAQRASPSAALAEGFVGGLTPPAPALALIQVRAFWERDAQSTPTQ